MAATDTFDIGGDLTVNRLGFGAMSLAGTQNMGWTDDLEGAKEVVRSALDLGVDFIDTADMYGNGSSELVVGDAIDVSRDDVVVATKGGILKQPDTETVVEGRPAYLRNAALRSRVRLQTDEIDLYQYHWPDSSVRFADSIRALAELKDAGVIRHVGLSNVSTEQIESARDITEIATVQNEYSVANRTNEDVLSYCESNDIGFIPYSPINKAELGERRAALEEIAAAHDATEYQVALAWLLERSPNVLPIPENVNAAAIELSERDLERLD
jgi:aryl-alcohol dehydrogenase-like predicted oxidoreductase